MESYEAHNTSESNRTFLSPVMFPDGKDRRVGARVPVDGAVRVGQPHQPPVAKLVAGDLGEGGIFIRSERSARVGARFSVEIPLITGDTVAIAEAEVLYNGTDAGHTGFGARFLDVPEDVRMKIRTAVSKVVSSLEDDGVAAGARHSDVSAPAPAKDDEMEESGAHASAKDDEPAKSDAPVKIPAVVVDGPTLDSVVSAAIKAEKKRKKGGQKEVDTDVIASRRKQDPAVFRRTEPQVSDLRLSVGPKRPPTPPPASEIKAAEDAGAAPPKAEEGFEAEYVSSSGEQPSSAPAALTVPSSEPIEISETPLPAPDAITSPRNAPIPPEAFPTNAPVAAAGAALETPESAAATEPLTIGDSSVHKVQMTAEPIEIASSAPPTAAPGLDKKIEDLSPTPSQLFFARGEQPPSEITAPPAKPKRKWVRMRNKNRSPYAPRAAAESEIGPSRWMKWTAFAVGAAIAIAIALPMLGSGKKGNAPIEPAARATPAGDNTGRGLTAETQGALLGSRDTVAPVVPEKKDKAPAEAKPVKNPLPPLVVLETAKREPMPASTIASTGAPAPVAAAPAAAATAPKKDAPAPAPATPAATKPAIAAQAPAVAAKTAPKTSGGGISLSIGGLSSGARVLKTHVLQDPPRFVIDLAGQSGEVKLPAAGSISDVGGVRVGKHPSYTRVVIDARRAIKKGEATRQGDSLKISLE